ncbi:hypothetical protein IG631_01648 [Alternaria alternata]|nr:hypothetical protein IG631_01648 [Alternaria alternata]
MHDLHRINGVLRCLGPAQSAPRGPSRALRASGQPIRRSTAARRLYAEHYRATGDPAAGWPARCAPRQGGQTCRMRVFVVCIVGCGPGSVCCCSQRIEVAWSVVPAERV